MRWLACGGQPDCWWTYRFYQPFPFPSLWPIQPRLSAACLYCFKRFVFALICVPSLAQEREWRFRALLDLKWTLKTKATTIRKKIKIRWRKKKSKNSNSKQWIRRKNNNHRNKNSNNLKNKNWLHDRQNQRHNKHRFQSKYNKQPKRNLNHYKNWHMGKHLQLHIKALFPQE